MSNYYIIYSFLNEYSQYHDVKKSISNGIDKDSICKIFHEYFAKLKDHLFMVYSDLPNEDKEGIFEYIYDYAILKIYQEIYPVKPSNYDKEFYNNVFNQSSLSAEQMNIKPKDFHPELIDLFVKSNSMLIK